jgi:hypothetical protein
MLKNLVHVECRWKRRTVSGSGCNLYKELLWWILVTCLWYVTIHLVPLSVFDALSLNRIQSHNEKEKKCSRGSQLCKCLKTKHKTYTQEITTPEHITSAKAVYPTHKSFNLSPHDVVACWYFGSFVLKCEWMLYKYVGHRSYKNLKVKSVFFFLNVSVERGMLVWSTHGYNCINNYAIMLLCRNNRKQNTMCSLFQIWTNGLYQSTLHRVLNNNSKYRVSVPFFYEVIFWYTFPSWTKPEFP